MLEILGLFLLCGGLYLLYCTVNPAGAGQVGRGLGKIFVGYLGVASFLIPFFLLLMGVRMIFPMDSRALLWVSVTVSLLVIDLDVILEVVRGTGGYLGRTIKYYLTDYLGSVGCYVVLVLIAVVCLLVLTGATIRSTLSWGAGTVKTTCRYLAWPICAGFRWIESILGNRRRSRAAPLPRPLPVVAERLPLDEAEVGGEGNLPPSVEGSAQDERESVSSTAKVERLESFLNYPSVEDLAQEVPVRHEYRLPPLDLFQETNRSPRGKPQRDCSSILIETLQSFGVEAKVVNVQRGPTVTRYEIQPARGVKVSRITNLANDIALVLAAQSLRIEAPVPGKSCIGVEVPNERVDLVHISEILESREFRERESSRLCLALGKDITGRVVVDDLLKMPHLLIAGATGSGKTVCINCVILSLLFKATPLEVRLVLIDPKRVELSIYEGIPHLVEIKGSPEKRIVTNPKAATAVLNQLTDLMDARYEQFASVRARNITEYNRKSRELMPYIVIVVDELADLMMISSATVETHICRLAQLGRAAGVHLILATQRPSVDVITGLIKANIPSRIAFAVSSQVDSRTILDRVGAEKLLGKGDMLYLPIDAAEPRRVQGAYVDSANIEEIVEFWKQQPSLENIQPISIEPKVQEEKLQEDGEDELFAEALRIIMTTGQASVSILQRRLKVGYARAGRLIDIMERRGIIGPAEGSKPRKILIPINPLEQGET